METNPHENFRVAHVMTEEGAMQTTMEDLAIQLAKELNMPLGKTDISGACFIVLSAHDKQDNYIGDFLGAAFNTSPQKLAILLANVIAALPSYIKNEVERKALRSVLAMAIGKSCSDMLEGLELGSLLMAASCNDKPEESGQKP